MVKVTFWRTAYFYTGHARIVRWVNSKREHGAGFIQGCGFFAIEVKWRHG